MVNVLGWAVGWTWSLGGEGLDWAAMAKGEGTHCEAWAEGGARVTSSADEEVQGKNASHVGFRRKGIGCPGELDVGEGMSSPRNGHLAGGTGRQKGGTALVQADPE